MKKPIIALTPRLKEINFNNLIYDFDSYFKAVTLAGGIPCLINYELLENPQDILDNFDGLIVTGGEDINPKFYNEKPYDNLQLTTDFIDESEFKIIKLFYNNNKPIFGICRGIQSINVFLNGNLYQDISIDLNIETIKHVQDYQVNTKINKSLPYHNVEFYNNSFMFDIFGNNYGVNSFHHQALKKVADNLIVVAKSTDNIIEAVVDKNKPVFAVQWHPERMINDSKHLDLFKHFINLCKNENN